MPDLRALRASLAAFAEAIGEPLTDWQARALELAVRITVIVAGRQLGKSRSLGLLALWWAYRKPGQRVLVVSAGEEAAKRVLGEVRRFATGSALLRGSVVDETAGLVTLSNGSEIRSVPASERQIRGWTVDLLLVDEAALVADDLLYGAALPTTAARPDARVVLSSSAVTTSGAFYDMAVQGESGSEYVRTHRWVSSLVGGACDAPWISASAIAQARESMGAQRFRAEYEAEFASGADALLSRADVEAVTADYVQTPFAHLALNGALGGIDWAGGQGRDRSTLVAVARLLVTDREPRFGVACAHGWGADTQPHRVIEDIAACRTVWAALYPEANGLGWPLSKQLARAMLDRPRTLGGGRRRRMVAVDRFDRVPEWVPDHEPRLPTVFRPLHVTAELKAAAYGTLRLLVHRGWLLVPASATELIRELLLLRVEVMPSGLERIETGGRDYASALMLSTGPFHHRGEWRSSLLEIAEQWARNGPQPLRADFAALPTVQTGAGVQVPRSPAWASATGADVTWPAGMEDLEEAERRRAADERRERIWQIIEEKEFASAGG